MRFQVLATDYDGTIAHDGVVHDETVKALKKAKAKGLRLVMVTGRELTELFNVFEHTELFERIVAENGAGTYSTRQRRRWIRSRRRRPQLSSSACSVRQFPSPSGTPSSRQSNRTSIRCSRLSGSSASSGTSSSTRAR